VPSNPFSSKIAATLLVEIGIYLKKSNLGHLTGEAGGYMVSGERYAPDIAFISFAKQREMARTGYNPNPPDLAVEVVSPTDSEKKLSIKVSNYLAAQTTVVVIYPDEREIAIHKPGERVTILGIEDTLTVESVLPNFKVAVKDIFPSQEEN
jgi:Uma2 family endonuclease